MDNQGAKCIKSTAEKGDSNGWLAG